MRRKAPKTRPSSWCERVMVSVRLKYVHRNRDRHGNVRVYFRRAGRFVRVHEPVGSPEFLATYNELLSATDGAKPSLGQKIGTLNWLVAEYTKPSRYHGLDPRTQRVQLLRLEGACAEPTKPDSTLLFGDVQCVHLTPKAIRVLRDRKKWQEACHTPAPCPSSSPGYHRRFARW